MAKRLRITGIVQGVAYRESMRREAARLGVKGWVRNRLDGSVEAMVDGDADAVESIIVWARRGPPAAQVRDVTIEASDEAGGDDFVRRPTA